MSEPRKIESNVEPDGFCMGCKRTMPVGKLLAHFVGGVCPDAPLDLVPTAKGKRLSSGRRRH